MKPLNHFKHHNTKTQSSLNDFNPTKGYGLYQSYSLRQHGEMQEDIKKMTNLNEVAPIKPLFEGIQKVENKDDLLDKTISIEAYAELKGEKEGEFYGVIKFLIDGECRTISINQMMTERLKEGVEKVGVNAEKSTAKEKVLATPIEAVIVKKKSANNGKEYYTFSDGSETEE